jgi:4-diphosphocytidyl-2-C-methyl-D-erythritol kinase
MKLFPNCKINIGLRVVRKREDGYHDLETIFYPVYGLCDELEVDPINQSQDHRQNSVEFIQEGLSVDCSTDDNLIIKCYNRMRAKYPQIGDVRIRFKKNIPFGAGLGGGSSDAAHMAIALNEIFNLGLTQEQLAQEVRHLGADCPFFVFNSPCYAEGIGDELTPIDLSLSDMRLVMIKPECGVSTKDAYGGILPKGNSELFRVAQNRLELFGMAYNDFEDTVFAIYPELASIKERLQDAGAIYTAMSGSGSTIYGLFQVDTECTTLTNLRLLHEEFASMIIFDDTLSKTKP